MIFGGVAELTFLLWVFLLGKSVYELGKTIEEIRYRRSLR